MLGLWGGEEDDDSWEEEDGEDGGEDHGEGGGPFNMITQEGLQRKIITVMITICRIYAFLPRVVSQKNIFDSPQ